MVHKPALVHCRVDGVGRAGPGRQPRAGKGTRYSFLPSHPNPRTVSACVAGMLFDRESADEEKQMILET